ncbi:MAG: hypothetical protein ACRCUY_12255, partial [Thermoguttaceae bacterium]
MRYLPLFLSIFLLFSGFPLSADEFQIGNVICSESFDSFENGWSKPNDQIVQLEANALKISLPANGELKNVAITKSLPVESLRNCWLIVTAKVKAENVLSPPNPWNGIKVMFVIDKPDGKDWIQQNGLWGTFDWKTVRFQVRVPENATSATLQLGLENTTGTTWIDDVEIKIIGKKVNADTISSTKPTFERGDVPKCLRGAMIQPNKFGPKDIQVLAKEWGANHVRWQLLWDGFPNGPADSASVDEFHAWIDKQCELLDKMLP